MTLGEIRKLPPTLSARQAAALLGVGKETLYDRAKEGSMPGVLRIGKRVVFSTPVLLKMLGIDWEEKSA